METISIIIATFNSSKTIRRCLDSVIMQTYKNWECIIIDGASKDKTIDIVEEYSKRNNQIRYISEPDSGIFEAFNKGWKLAKGDWIYYLGSDDQLLPDGLSELLNQSDNSNNYDLIYGNIQFVKSDGTIVIHKHSSHLQLPWKTFACHQAVIMRRTVIEKLNGFDENLQVKADKDLIIRSYYLNPRCRYKGTEAIVALFYGGGTSSDYYKAFKEDIYIYKKVKPGIMFLLYALQHLPRMILKKKLKFV